MIGLINKNKRMILDLASNDFATKYAGSSFGIFWAFVQPVITILVYWVVFQFGLKAAPPVSNVSYILWFAAGMVPWFFFSEGLNAVTNCLLEYSYLVKKVLFDIDMLPVIKIISALFVHMFFILLLFIVAICTGQGISIYALQIAYYLLAAIYLTYALGEITSAIILFFRDLGQIVNIILQIGVWATPIIWSYTIIPEKFQWIIKLNPMFYIVEGYRDSLYAEQWFWQKPVLSCYFWAFTLIVLLIGKKVFNKMKPHFADVL